MVSRRARRALAMAAVLQGLVGLAWPTPAAEAQTCSPRAEVTLAPESYQSVTDRVYVYLGTIPAATSAPGYGPFTLQVLVGQYRRPFLLPQASLKEADFKSLFAQRSDVQQLPLQVGAPAKNESIAVEDRGRKLTVRVLRVTADKSGAAQVALEICG